MCLKKVNPQTIPEIINQKSMGMTAEEKSQYAYEISQDIFDLLLRVDVPLVNIGGWSDWAKVAQSQYPGLTDIRIPDSSYQITTLGGLQDILSLDWTNKVTYLADIFDCDAFAEMLYIHLRKYYKINSVFPVWGTTTQGYHGFNCAVVKDGDAMIARLIEPQTDAVFIDEGPLGKYSPDKTAEFLAVMKSQSPSIKARKKAPSSS